MFDVETNKPKHITLTSYFFLFSIFSYSGRYICIFETEIIALMDEKRFASFVESIFSLSLNYFVTFSALLSNIIKLLME